MRCAKVAVASHTLLRSNAHISSRARALIPARFFFSPSPLSFSVCAHIRRYLGFVFRSLLIRVHGSARARRYILIYYTTPPRFLATHIFTRPTCRRINMFTRELARKSTRSIHSQLFPLGICASADLPFY